MTKIPGNERCDYCGELLNDRQFGEYAFSITRDEVPYLYHINCRDAFKVKMKKSILHRVKCHLEGCDIFPRPVRWIDQVDRS